jgi:hypothetical protein
LLERAVQRIGLMCVQLVDPGGCERVDGERVELVGDRDGAGVLRGDDALVLEAFVLAPGREQGVPRLCLLDADER